jgi:hypothetical protein
MAAPAPPIVVPPGSPPPLGVSQLPYAADTGSLTGWLLDTTATETSSGIVGGLDRSFNRLVHNVPLDGDPGHDEAMLMMVDEIVNSDTLTTYLTATNFGAGEVKISVIHSIARYSAGFGGSNALHGQTLGLLGEMREDKLPMLVKFNPDPAENLAHALTMEEVTVPPDAALGSYFTTPTATYLIPQVTTAQGGVEMNLSNFCPIPLAWAPYFLDFKEPYEALQVGHLLVASLNDATQRARASPMLDWM